MIPSTLTDIGAPPSKGASGKDMTTEQADGVLFGDLVDVPSEVPVVREGRLDLRKPGAEQKLQEVEIQPDTKESTIDQPASGVDETGVTARRMITDAVVGPSPAVNAKLSIANEAEQFGKKAVIEKAVSGQNIAGRDAVPAAEDALKSANSGERPSVAQTVVEGRLPQQIRTESVGKPDQLVTPDFAKNAPTSPTPAIPAIPDKKLAIRQEGPDIGSIEIPSDEKREQRHDIVRDNTAGIVQRIATPSGLMGPPPAVALAQAAVQMKPDKAEESTKLIVSDVALGAAQTDRPSSMQSVQASVVPSATTETARHVANQIAVAITNTTGKTTEISLNPEELGRVRLSLSISDGAVTLNVLAERAETQDLMRRHLDQLAQEFRALGYSSIEFSFGDQSQNPQAEQAHSTDTTEPDKQEDVKTTDIVSKQATVGLDLRI